MPELVAYSKNAIANGSRSFSFAARVFDEETRRAVAHLYAWCRFCDDRVDEAVTDAERIARVSGLREQTERALRGEPQREQAFAALRAVAVAYELPREYLFDLLCGFEADAQGKRYETLDELLWYCYCVAGTVGVLMSRILGARDTRAFAHALDLGMAMQLTNIARDVLEDAALGRVYLPLEWLREAGLSEHDMAYPRHRARLAAVVERLLVEADQLYASGDTGLKYLPRRSALAVSIARHVYAGIGTRVRGAGANAWDRRVVVPWWQKLLLAVKAIRSVAA